MAIQMQDETRWIKELYRLVEDQIAMLSTDKRNQIGQRLTIAEVQGALCRIVANGIKQRPERTRRDEFTRVCNKIAGESDLPPLVS